MSSSDQNDSDYNTALKQIKLDEMQEKEMRLNKLALTRRKLNYEKILEHIEQTFFVSGPRVKNSFKNQGKPLHGWLLKRRPA